MPARATVGELVLEGQDTWEVSDLGSQEKRGEARGTGVDNSMSEIWQDCGRCSKTQLFSNVKHQDERSLLKEPTLLVRAPFILLK